MVFFLNFQIGSTEWVEQNLATLDSKAVAYINVDCAVQGPGLFAGATPQLDDLLVEVTKKVKYMKNGESNLLCFLNTNVNFWVTEWLALCFSLVKG